MPLKFSQFMIMLLPAAVLAVSGLQAQPVPPCDYPVPDPPFLEASICPGETVRFQIDDSTGIFFQWADTTAGPVRVFYKAGKYNLVIGNGCDVRTYSIFISNCEQDPYVPTAFSPNGDGVNDIFRARGPALSRLLLEVFNRKGELVFTAKEPADFWDGTVNGAEAPAGVYMWRLSAGLLSGRRVDMKGELVLVR